MDTLNDAEELVAKAPSWFWMVLGLVLMGVAWKKSALPNRWLPVVNLLVGGIVYPIIAYRPSLDQKFYHPVTTLVLIGLLIGLLAEVAHEGIVAKLKARFPWLAWPEDSTTKNAESTEKNHG